LNMITGTLIATPAWSRATGTQEFALSIGVVA
jgi:hypothetical protein